ncbi:MAG: hypothetical protein CMD33_02215 [Flavobacteriales bacterium]|nr:hypothetical protein [Crocinitomicaceae bacterium]MBO74068.1 hypothetical protein [Flavobacteriales bacterium]|tara:strand:- start:532 stop:765 length:234 start_codon:yes stop_codon:yes gene_type:complete
MNSLRKFLPVVLALVAVFAWENMTGQCVMCKAVAEDSADDGGLGAGLNRGILYLMAIPYILLSALFFVIYKKRNSAS